MSSCVEREVLEFNDSIVFLVSEVNPDKRVELTLHTNQITNQGVIYPQDAKLSLSGTGLDGGKLGFTFIERENKYLLRNPSFRVQKGGEYVIEAEIPSLGFTDIVGTTTIPNEVKIANIEVKTDEVTSGELVDYFFNITVNLEQDSGSKYLHILPKYEQIDASSHRPSGIKENLQIIEFTESASALRDLFNEDGILVNRDNLTNESFQVRLSTTNLVRKVSGDGPGMVHFEVRSVNEEYYKYHNARSGQSQCASSNLSSCPSDYTNIINGLGVFSGYSTTHQSFSL